MNIGLVNTGQRAQEQRRRHPPPCSQQTDCLLRSTNSTEPDLVEGLKSSRDSSNESGIRDSGSASPFSQRTKSPFYSNVTRSTPLSLPISQSELQSELQSNASLEPTEPSLSTSQIVNEMYQNGCRLFETERLRIGGVVLHSALLSGKQMVRTDYLCCCDPFDNKKTAKQIDVREGGKSEV